MTDRVRQLREFLKEADATYPCHRCGGEEMSIVDGITSLSFDKKPFEQDRILNIMLVICVNCAAVTAHAIGALKASLIDKQEEKNLN